MHDVLCGYNFSHFVISLVDLVFSFRCAILRTLDFQLSFYAITIVGQRRFIALMMLIDIDCDL